MFFVFSFFFFYQLTRFIYFIKHLQNYKLSNYVIRNYDMTNMLNYGMVYLSNMILSILESILKVCILFVLL